jgi:hypothetical protein
VTRNEKLMKYKKQQEKVKTQKKQKKATDDTVEADAPEEC